jgi:hypothetical protein
MTSTIGGTPFASQSVSRLYGVAIKPLAVATIQRLPQRTIESTRPIPGTVSPRVAIRTPSGPSRTAVPSRTSRTVQPSIVVGRVSGAGIIGSRDATEPVRSWTAGEAVLEEPVYSGATPGNVARRLAEIVAPTVETVLTAGDVCKPDVYAVFRVPSVLPPDFLSAIRREGVSV